MPSPATKRELEIIRLVADGLKNKEISAVVGTTEHSVKNCVRRVYDKLGMCNRVELALWHCARTQELETQ